MLFILRLKKIIKYYIIRALFDKNAKNIFQQIYEIIILMHKTQYSPQNYFKFNGYKKGVKIDDILGYMPGKLFDSIREDLINDKNFQVLLENKYIFNKFLTHNNIPCTEILGIFDKNVGFFDKDFKLIDYCDFVQNLKCDFVIKPIYNSAQGDGVFVFEYIENNKWKLNNNDLTSNELSNFLYKNISSKMLIEKKVEQHQIINNIYPLSLNTIRIDTIKANNNHVDIVGSFFRVGRAGKRVDNWSEGNAGIAVPIDLEKGILKGNGLTYKMEEFICHPDTNEKFIYTEIPYFEEIKKMIKQTALLIPQINSIGWDVAITTHGPIIIEGNHDYSIQPLQLMSGAYYKKEHFVFTIKDYIERNKKGKKYEKYFNNKY